MLDGAYDLMGQRKLMEETKERLLEKSDIELPRTKGLVIAQADLEMFSRICKRQVLLSDEILGIKELQSKAPIGDPGVYAQAIIDRYRKLGYKWHVGWRR